MWPLGPQPAERGVFRHNKGVACGARGTIANPAQPMAPTAPRAPWAPPAIDPIRWWYADIGASLCGIRDDDLRDTAKGLTVGSRELVVCEGCQGGFHAACVRALPSMRWLPLPAGHPATLDWPTENMGRGFGT